MISCWKTKTELAAEDAELISHSYRDSPCLEEKKEEEEEEEEGGLYKEPNHGNLAGCCVSLSYV